MLRGARPLPFSYKGQSLTRGDAGLVLQHLRGESAQRRGHESVRPSATAQGPSQSPAPALSSSGPDRPTILLSSSSRSSILNSENSFLKEVLVLIERRKRKVSKNGVVTTLGFPEGQTVTVIRVDERTEIISLEPPERLEAMVALLSKPRQERHSALMQRLQGRAHDSGSTLSREHTAVELEAPLSEADADRVVYRGQNRRTF